MRLQSTPKTVALRLVVRQKRQKAGDMMKCIRDARGLSHVRSAATLSLALSLLCNHAWGQLVDNGAMTGSIATHSLVPPGWTNLSQGTADTVDSAGHPFRIFNGIGPQPYGVSSNGGAFLWAGDAAAFSPGLPEGVRQTITGLSTGETYTLTFEHTNLGLYDDDGNIATNAFLAGQNYDSSGRWIVLLDNAQLGATASISPFPTPGTHVWMATKLIFVATSHTHEIAFVADHTSGMGTFVGMGLDGVGLYHVPRIRIGLVNPSSMEISWQSTSGAVYQAQSTASLSPSSWTNVLTSVTGSGEVQSLIDSNALPATLFYRLLSQ